MYAIWIGTNDVGVNALLTDGIGVRSGVSIVEVRKCVVNVVETLYESGARNFVILNVSQIYLCMWTPSVRNLDLSKVPMLTLSQMIPLNLTPLYSRTSYPNPNWSAVRNTTEWNIFMYELVRAGNAITDLMFQTVAPRLQGAHIGECLDSPFPASSFCSRVSLPYLLMLTCPASFDAYALFSDMFVNPGAYLNGTAANPAGNGPVYNVTGCVNSCVLQLNESLSGPATCTIVQDEVQQDAYLWWVFRVTFLLFFFSKGTSAWC